MFFVDSSSIRSVVDDMAELDFIFGKDFWLDAVFCYEEFWFMICCTCYLWKLDILVCYFCFIPESILVFLLS